MRTIIKILCTVKLGRSSSSVSCVTAEIKLLLQHLQLSLVLSGLLILEFCPPSVSCSFLIYLQLTKSHYQFSLVPDCLSGKHNATDLKQLFIQSNL